MKILIAYTSNHGTTAECADMLADKLRSKHDVVVKNMKKESVEAPQNYDVVVLGSSVRMGRISKSIKKYLKKNIEALNNMPSAVFLCCGFPDEFEEYVKYQLPKEYAPSYGAHCFGGELKPKKVRGVEKIIVNALRKSITQHDFEDSTYNRILPEIIPEHIEILADKIMNKHRF